MLGDSIMITSTSIYLVTQFTEEYHAFVCAYFSKELAHKRMTELNNTEELELSYSILPIELVGN